MCETTTSFQTYTNAISPLALPMKQSTRVDEMNTDKEPFYLTLVYSFVNTVQIGRRLLVRSKIYILYTTYYIHT